ncbi:CapA family protein [Domibacillus epiphyticus]|uniref:Capsular biosynthesis protein n=1 Tax=Domibacillus epiphyticus TaxID=1714355 RepID=A0A1V2AA69_9BACI|nr:CapA family protein [Domibacillus epiphyticus]OMP67895.1 capsular biosynthesis protein [Domibacillus epiphyticus]
MTGQRSEEKRKKRRLKRWVRLTILALFLSIFAALIVNLLTTSDENDLNDITKNNTEQEQDQVAEPKETKETISISAAGDFTLGTDETFTYEGSFPHEAEKNGLEHFTAELGGVFEEDDLSTVNLETTLTEATEKAEKKFRFKGDPEYTQILIDGDIEAVNLANNHIHDYLQQGYDDTIANLKKEKIGYFGYDNQYVTEIKGVKVAALGYEGWQDSAEIREQVEGDIQKLRDDGVEIIIVHFHWGVERSYVPEESQKTLARFTVDTGADLVVGHHPHVVQGIEEYKGKFIVYSLGNFMFGGNRNPSDKDTFVFQQTFHLKNGKLTDQKEINVVPFSISSLTERNNYQPKRLQGAEKQRVMNKIIEVSNQINGTNAEWMNYQKETTGN